MEPNGYHDPSPWLFLSNSNKQQCKMYINKAPGWAQLLLCGWLALTLSPPPLPPAVVDLLYWRDVKTTGIVFGAALLLLLSLMVCSIVSVCSYIGLALLSVTICFRIYKGILQAIQKSDEGHPFKWVRGSSADVAGCGYHLLCVSVTIYRRGFAG